MTSPPEPAALTLEHLRVLATRRERIGDLCREISSSRDPTEAARVCARHMLAIFPELGRASIALTEDDEHCRIHGLAGEATILGEGTRLPLATTIVGHGIRDARQYVVRDAPGRVVTPEIEVMFKAGFRVIAVTPFVIVDRAIGSLNVASADPDAFDSEDLAILWQIAAIVGANLERHRLVAALQVALQDSLAREHQLEASRVRQEQIIRAQQQSIEETAAPTLPISDRVIVIPVVGSLDDDRARHFVNVVVQGCHEHRSEVVIIDLTGLRRFDSAAGQSLNAVASALRLLGARIILTGIPPDLASALVDLDLDFANVRTSSTLQSAVAEALAAQTGRRALTTRSSR